MNPEKRRNSVFRAFRSRNFSLYFTGQSVSQIGTWMQNTGVSWVVYTTTHSTFMLGMTMFALLFPRFVFSPLGGIWADRYNRYKIMLITQIASMVQAALLAGIVLFNHYSVWMLFVLSAVLGVINAFDSPARQPMLHEMLFDKDDLSNAVALNSSMVNFARIIGPALSGIILVKLGAGVCFLLNTVSFAAVIGSLLLMKLPPQGRVACTKKKMSAELLEGFVYIKNRSSLGLILLMLSLASLLILSFETLLPVFAKEIYKGDAATFGYIRSFIGLGAIGGTLLLASLRPGSNLNKVLLVCTVVLGIGLIFFSQISYFPVAMIFAVLLGFGSMSQTTIWLTIVQLDTEPYMRGRVMSYLIMAMAGLLPLGSLLVGVISKYVGVSTTLLCQGIIALIMAGVFAKVFGLKKKDMAIDG